MIRQILIDEADTFTAQDLEKLYTKQLLSKLESVTAIMSSIVFNFWGDSSEHEDWTKLNKYKKLIKQVLATREHIPNKKEAKKIRQEKARRK